MPVVDGLVIDERCGIRRQQVGWLREKPVLRVSWVL